MKRKVAPNALGSMKSRIREITNRNGGCGPVWPVVWEGISGRSAAPYPDRPSLSPALFMSASAVIACLCVSARRQADPLLG